MAVRILVADDHPVVRRGMTNLLGAQPGWEVMDEAVDGQQAVEKASRLNPDVVILDLSMPRMGGLDACRMILKNDARIEILVVTQHDSRQMMREAEAAGAKGYVVKSNIARDLIKAVERVSEHKWFGLESDASKGFA